MALVKRKPRKTIKLRDAMEIFGESRTSINNRIARGELIAIRGRGKTSPKRLYAAQVEQVAKAEGLL